MDDDDGSSRSRCLVRPPLHMRHRVDLTSPETARRHLIAQMTTLDHVRDREPFLTHRIRCAFGELSRNFGPMKAAILAGKIAEHFETEAAGDA